MAVYCAIVEDAENNVDWNGTSNWGFDATSDKYNPTPHVNQAARDAQYTAVYASLNEWEGARDGEASGDDEYAIIQGLWDNNDTNTFDIIGWTCTSITIIAIGNARHAGVWNDGADSPHRVVASDGSYISISMQDSVTYDGLQIHNTVLDDAATSNIRIGSTNSVIRECVLDCADTGGIGVLMNTADASGIIYNTIIYRSPEAGDGEGVYCDNGDTLDIYNCTIYGFGSGIERDKGTCTSVNNIVFANDDDFEGTVGITTCGSDDADAGTVQPSGGDWANEMSGYAGLDFTLDSAGNMYDGGTTDPSGDGETLDITGATRTVNWSIGAFEYDVAGGVAPTGTIFGPFGGPFRGVL